MRVALPPQLPLGPQVHIPSRADTPESGPLEPSGHEVGPLCLPQPCPRPRPPSSPAGVLGPATPQTKPMTQLGAGWPRLLLGAGLRETCG